MSVSMGSTEQIKLIIQAPLFDVFTYPKGKSWIPAGYYHRSSKAKRRKLLRQQRKE